MFEKIVTIIISIILILLYKKKVMTRTYTYANLI